MQTANRSIEYIILLTRRVFSAFSNISLELRWKGTNSMNTELWIPPLMGAVSTPTRFFPEFFCTLSLVSHGFIVYNDSCRLQNTKIVGKRLDVKRWFGRNSGKPMPEEILRFRSFSPARFFTPKTLLKTFIIPKVGDTELCSSTNDKDYSQK